MKNFELIPIQNKDIRYNKNTFACTQAVADYINTQISSEYMAIVIDISDIYKYVSSFEPVDIVLKNGGILTIYDYELECTEAGGCDKDCITEHCDNYKENNIYTLYMEEISHAAGFKYWYIHGIPQNAKLIIIELVEYINKLNKSDNKLNNLTDDELNFLLT